jgi:hypothetical protein
MKLAALTVCCLLLVTCEMPLGDRGRYGTVGAYYKAPEIDWNQGPTFLPDKQ